MNRFFCLRKDVAQDNIVINDLGQCHHIRDVLKLKLKEKVVVFDEGGQEYNCIISDIGDKVHLKIQSLIFPPQGKVLPKLTIACAIPKKAKTDDIIDKLVQLGVYRFIPLKTERVVVKLDKHKEDLRLQRWKKIALSAAKQSQRASLLVIDNVTEFKDLIAKSNDFDLKLIPCLSDERINLKDTLTGAAPSNIIVLIGPEGDFSDKEVQSAKNAGFIPVSLGDLVLRVDTAAVSVASFIRLYAYR
jgi:16S rRNA (uracil1498-N3)-methyltransferase